MAVHEIDHTRASSAAENVWIGPNGSRLGKDASFSAERNMRAVY